MFRHTSCALKKVDVNYSNGEGFVSFNDGSPAFIQLKLEFAELAILSREEITQGY